MFHLATASLVQYSIVFASGCAPGYPVVLQHSAQRMPSCYQIGWCTAYAYPHVSYPYQPILFLGFAGVYQRLCPGSAMIHPIQGEQPDFKVLPPLRHRSYIVVTLYTLGKRFNGLYSNLFSVSTVHGKFTKKLLIKIACYFYGTAPARTWCLPIF